MYSSTAYAPFGESQASQTSGAADASFTGQDQDTVASLYDFTFRRYSPSQGRWISPDPLGAGAVDIGNPQTWNRYAYVGNGPTGAIDAWGLKSMPCISSPVSCMMGGGGGDCTVNNPDGTQTTTTLDGLDASCGQINSSVQIGATQGGSINSAGQSVAIGVSSNGQGGLSVWIDGGCVSAQDNLGNSTDASCVPGAYVTLLDLAASAAANNGNCGITVKCRGIQTDNLGKIGMQHCDAQVTTSSGQLWSLSGGPQPNYMDITALNAWATSPPTEPFTGTTVYQGNSCSAAGCMVQSTQAWNQSVVKPEYRPVSGPNSNTWLKGTAAGCGVSLPIGTWGSIW
jgi:RHS repeat-associated protein